MEYRYFNRGKCVFCNQVIWNTAPNMGIMCVCTKAFLSDIDNENTVSISDEEFIVAIQSELHTSDEIQLIKIT